MNTLLELVILYFNSSFKNDIYNNIAQYIMQNLYLVKDMSITDLAKSCYTSTTSISKFCKLFNYDSYKEFKKDLVSTHEAKLRQLEYRHQEVKIENIYQIYKLASADEEIIKLEELLSISNSISNIMFKSKRIILFGAVYPLSIAFNFQGDLCALGKPVFCKHTMLSFNDFSLNKGDLAIIITVTGRYVKTRIVEFNTIFFSDAKKIIISQNTDFCDSNIIEFNIPLPGNKEIIEMNYCLMAVFDLIKYQYYQNYHFV